MKTKGYIALVFVLTAGLIAGLAGYLRFASVATAPAARSPLPAQHTGRRRVAGSALAGAPSAQVQTSTAALREPNGKLKGTVLTRSGAPLSTATVCWVGNGGVGVQRCTQTDESGEYELLGLSADVRGLLASAPGHRSRLQPIRAAIEGVLRQDVRLDAEPDLPRLRGLVVDATGGWVAWAIVSALSPDSAGPLATTFTGSDGRFELGVARRGTVELVAEAAGYSRGSRRVVAPAAELTLVLVPAAEISGRVVQLESQEPVGDVEVIARMEDGVSAQTSSVRSASDGSFRLGALAAGRLELEAQGSTWRSETSSFVLGVGQALEGVTLSVSPGSSLTAEIRTAGAPCPHAFLHLSGAHSALARADASGVLRIQGLVPGRYRASGGCPTASRTPVDEELVVSLEPLHRIWDLPTDAAEDAEVACCEPVGSIQVQVDGNGAEVDSLRVWASPSNNPRASMPGQRQGELTVFERLSLGHYDVYLDQSPETRAPVTLERDGQVTRVQLQAPRRTQLSGRVLDGRGLPLPDAWVKAIPREGRLNEGAIVPVLSDSDGAFTLSGLYPTRYDVSVESPVGQATASDVIGGTHGLVLKVSN